MTVYEKITQSRADTDRYRDLLQARRECLIQELRALDKALGMRTLPNAQERRQERRVRLRTLQE